MPNFTYTRDIPESPHNPSIDQGPMKTNNNSIDSIISIDHFGFNDNQGGKHKQVELPVRIGDFPNVIGQGTAYAKVAGAGNDAQLFWRFANGATPPLQLTGNQFATGLTNGYVPLMNGMLLQWGVVTPLVQTNAVLFATSNVNFQNNCFIVTPILITSGATTSNAQAISIVTGTVSKFGFTANYSGGSAYSGFYWLALGN